MTAILQIKHEEEIVLHLRSFYIAGLAEYAPEIVISQHPHQLIDKVNAPVVQHAAAVLLFTAPTEHYSTGSMQSGLDGIHLSQFPGIKDILNDPEVLVPTAVLMYGEEFPVATSRGNHLIQLVHVQSGRLLADDMLAGIRRGNADLHVTVVRHGNQNSVDVLTRKQILQGRKSPEPAFLRHLYPHGVNVVSAYHLNPFNFGSVSVMKSAHSSVANNSQLNPHVHFPPFFAAFLRCV